MVSALPTSMQAVVRYRYGPPETVQLAEVQTPRPGQRELLVRVHACTVNRTDCAIATGKPFIMRFFTGLSRPGQPILGTDFAGEIVAIGEEVSNFQVGDRIWGFDDQGLASQAEYVTVRSDKPIALIPSNATWATAAASAEAAHYALNFLNKVQLKPGDRVLINGASGGIGSALLQFCHDRGAHVTAVCAAPQTEAIRALGADVVIDYLSHDFTATQETYDFVLDAVGKSTFGRCKQILKPRGIYISSELGPYVQNPWLALLGLFSRGKRVIFPIPTDIPASLKLFSELLASGRFRPLIDRTYPLAEAREAYRYVASGQKIGNVILQIRKD